MFEIEMIALEIAANNEDCLIYDSQNKGWKDL
jgi:hypothetical protein